MNLSCGDEEGSRVRYHSVLMWDLKLLDCAGYVGGVSGKNQQDGVVSKVKCVVPVGHVS
jgi:hypothetical protein